LNARQFLSVQRLPAGQRGDEIAAGECEALKHRLGRRQIPGILVHELILQSRMHREEIRRRPPLIAKVERRLSCAMPPMLSSFSRNVVIALASGTLSPGLLPR